MATDIDTTGTEEGQHERTRTGQYYRPHVDILEKPDELLLVADMPGVSRDSIQIDFEDGVLKLEGKVAPRLPDGKNFLLVEYGIGDFYRTFRVSEQVDASRISAEYGNGVLTVHLPKVEAAKPRTIQVTAGN